MEIASPAFKQNGLIPEKYTCDGDNVNPPLRFRGMPKDTRSLCLIVHDHDAQGGDFVHWLAWNIDPETTGINEATSIAAADEGRNDFGETGWGGPCPPQGMHHYEFHLYALDVMLDLPAGADKTALRKKIAGHILEECSLTGVYTRE